jgi:hypothetical protein
MVKNGLIITLMVLVNAVFNSTAMAWGGRGHHSICHSAVFLLKENGLREYLQTRPHMMGHLCNIPDFWWKSLGTDANKLGNPSHFIDLEILAMAPKDVPADYQKIVDQYTGQKNQFKKEGNIFSIPTEFGSVWWRADQFFRRAIGVEKDWKLAVVPASPKEEQDENFPYNKFSYDFIVNLGLMGHFVADASQPFHGTSDYDGYAVGHGGIHAFYEDLGVGAVGPELELKVVEAGKKLQILANKKDKNVKFLTNENVIERMRALSEISIKEMAPLLAVDPVTKPSEVKMEKGMSLRTPAMRKDISVVAKKFEPFIIKEMSRSATLLAQIWDEAYIKVGRPKMTAYKSYKYPFTPEFVAPDYFKEKTPEAH